MNRDEIIAMAREAGIDYAFGAELERFAALVEERTLTKQKARYWQEGYEAGAAAEREACAKACEASVIEWTEDSYNRGCKDSAAAIRARGNDETA